MPLQKNQSIRLPIDSLSSDGSGVGRHEGQAVFVPGSAAGDIVKVKVVKAAKTYAFGRVEQVLSPSAERIPEECPASKACGGCVFRHISYEAECRAKQGFVQDALTRIGGFSLTVQPILPSPMEKRYRNKMQLPLAPGENGRILSGFFASRSHRIVPCDDCLLQPESLGKIAAYIVQLLEERPIAAYDETTRKGLVRHLYLRRGFYSGEVMVCIVSTHELPEGEAIAAEIVAEFPAVRTVVQNLNNQNTNVILGDKTTVLYGDGVIEDTLAGVPLALDVYSFAQVNTPSAERLFTVAKEYANIQPEETLLDLYCGAGVIGLSMADGCKALVGVEVVPQAVENARRSAAAMGLTNTRFITADAGRAATQLAEEGLRPDVITVDPPRKGCDETTIAALVQMSPERIVMVSCNPATLARDLKRLAEAGYMLQKVQPVDMFPRTKHVEAVALLVQGTV